MSILDDPEGSKKRITQQHLEKVKPATKRIIAICFIKACHEAGITTPVNPSSTDVAKALGVQKLLVDQGADVTIMDLIEDMCTKWNTLESIRGRWRPKPELGMLPLVYKELLQKREDGDSDLEVIHIERV